MPSMDFCMTWAVPVKVEVLGAHLEAYIESLPAISGLRLCNRFGRGPQAFINTLPTELVARIEAELVGPAREKSLEEWSRDFKCFEQSCDLFAHHSRKRLLEIYWETRDAFGHPQTDPSDVPSDEQLNALLRGAAGTDLHTSHFEEREKWRNRIGYPIKPDKGSFSAHRDFFSEKFGLHIWLSHVRLEHDPNRVSIDDGEPAESTVAFLTLPKSGERSLGWSFSESDCAEFDVQNGVGMPIKVNGRPTKKSLARFQRALTTLGLEASPHDSQRARSLAFDGFENEEDDDPPGESTHWPRLMILTRSESGICM